MTCDVGPEREQELAQLIKETSLVKIPCHKVSVMGKKQKGWLKPLCSKICIVRVILSNKLIQNPNI